MVAREVNQVGLRHRYMFAIPVICNMFCFKLPVDATKRAIDFGGKKNSKSFSLFKLN